ncbi:branched-chain amino acid ABC transporter permease [Parapusillimonas sp. JC17]|uniref:branched-chain amino acid ABC transporter permease n=1 Tax=Parapusillimonas sp. JC17 TaxID=3445768 RepID=UPI003F9F1BEC
MLHTLKGSRALLLVSLAIVFIFAWSMLHAETEQEVGLMIGVSVVLVLAARWLRVTPPLVTANNAYPRALGVGCVVGTLLLVAAFFDNHFALLLICTVLLYSIAGFGLNIQFGYCGVLNFAGAAFFGIGSYTAAVLAEHTGTPHLLILFIGGVFAALIGSLLILPVLRTRGHYAALVTIAFGVLFKTFLEVNDVLGGPQGLRIPRMNIFGWELNENITIGETEISFYANYAVLSLILCVLAFVLVRRLERSWIGVSMDVVRTDEIAASVFGIPIARMKIIAFTLGNFLVGIAGAVYGLLTSYVAPNNFTFADSLILVSMVLLGGIGNPWGILPAAAIILILPEKLQFIQEYRFLLYGILVIAILLFRPAGLLPRSIRSYFPGQSKA